MQRSYLWLTVGMTVVLNLPTIALATEKNSYIQTSRPRNFVRFAETSFEPSYIAHQEDSELVTSSPVNLWQQLNLSPIQKHRIKRISRRYQQQIAKLKQDLQQAQKQLAQMMVGSDTVGVIRAKHEDINKLRKQLADLHFEGMLATREVLNLQQRQKFAEIIGQE